jgi:hypothetical protein
MLEIRKEQMDALGADTTKTYETSMPAIARMLKIREEQMDVLERQARATFEKRMITVLSKAHPEIVQQILQDDLNLLISSGIDEAINYGIIYRRDIELYLIFLLRFGPGFKNIDPQKAWITEILPDESLSGSEKVNMMSEVIDSPG